MSQTLGSLQGAKGLDPLGPGSTSVTLAPVTGHRAPLCGESDARHPFHRHAEPLSPGA